MLVTKILLTFLLVVNVVIASPQNASDINSTHSPAIPHLLSNFVAKLPQPEKNVLEKYLLEQNQMAENFKKVACILPAYDFTCAMNTMNMEITNIYNNKGITYLACEDCKWPKRIYDIRKDNDLCDEVPSLMYGESDDIGIKKWYTFTSQNPKKMKFNIPPDRARLRDSLIPKFKKFAGALHTELNKYYDELNKTLKQTRYPKGKPDLFSHFAAIIQRSYRIGNYYTRALQFQIRKHMRRKYPNGTNFYLANALKVSIPTWYFDEEHVDVLNILRKAEGYTEKEDLFYVVANLTNILEQSVVIPGLRNCGKQPMPLDFYRQCYL